MAWFGRIPELVTLGVLAVSTVAFGTTAELRRAVTVTDTVNEDVRNQRLAMSTELKRSGCEEVSLTGFISPNRPSELVLMMTCMKWGTGPTDTPAKK